MTDNYSTSIFFIFEFKQYRNDNIANLCITGKFHLVEIEIYYEGIQNIEVKLMFQCLRILGTKLIGRASMIILMVYNFSGGMQNVCVTSCKKAFFKVCPHRASASAAAAVMTQALTLAWNGSGSHFPASASASLCLNISIEINVFLDALRSV